MNNDWMYYILYYIFIYYIFYYILLHALLLHALFVPVAVYCYKFVLSTSPVSFYKVKCIFKWVGLCWTSLIMHKS